MDARALEPLWSVAYVNVGRCYLFARRFEDAVRELRLAVEMGFHDEQMYHWLGRALCAQGRFHEALAEVERGMRALGRLPALLSTQGYAGASLGARAQALEDLEELQKAKPDCRLVYYYEMDVQIALGDLEAVHTCLERAFEGRSGFLPFLRADPLLDPLRSEPWFVALLERLRLDF